MKTSFFRLLPMLCLLFAACQKQVQVSESTQLEVQSQVVAEPCGTPVVKEIWDAGGNIQLGTVSISNDETNVYVTFTGAAGRTFKRIAYVAGSYQKVYDAFTLPNYNYTACQGPNTKDAVLMPNASPYTITLPASTFQQDGCLWFGFLVTTSDNLCGGYHAANGSDEWFGSAAWQSGFQYCKQDCPPQGECGQLRTQTPGGWGAPPAGNNPGSYLHKNFAGAFNNELTVGCFPGNYYIKLTSAQAITDLLPTGGKAAKLTSNLVNPAEVKNVLVGHLVALTLAVGFDTYDSNFGQAGITLGDMDIKSGTFAGWSVSQFLAEANAVLGGCSTNYTPQQVLEVATAINENYVDGKTDKGFLVCPN